MKNETQPTHLVKVWSDAYNDISPNTFILGSKRPAYKDNEGLGYKVLSEQGQFLYCNNSEVEVVATINY